MRGAAANQRSRLRKDDTKIKFSEQSSCHSNPVWTNFMCFFYCGRKSTQTWWTRKNHKTAEELEHKWHCLGQLFHANLHYILWFNCIIPRRPNLGTFGSFEYDGVHDVNFVFRCAQSRPRNQFFCYWTTTSYRKQFAGVWSVSQMILSPRWPVIFLDLDVLS